MEFIEENIRNPGILSSKMDETTFTNLSKYVEHVISGKDQNKVMRRNLLKDRQVQGVGEAFYITSLPADYKSYLFDFSKEYGKYYKMNNTNKVECTIDQVWINLQKRYEFRPNHAHSDSNGKNLSFVTYVKIPYDIKEEDAYNNHSSVAEIHRNGRIEFVLQALDGTFVTKQINISKAYEGVTLLFPNSLMHTVYPFYTSEDYRVSIAGNINFIQ